MHLDAGQVRHVTTAAVVGRNDEACKAATAERAPVDGIGDNAVGPNTATFTPLRTLPSILFRRRCIANFHSIYTCKYNDDYGILLWAPDAVSPRSLRGAPRWRAATSGACLLPFSLAVQLHDSGV
jgi:hypothetical protein